MMKIVPNWFQWVMVVKSEKSAMLLVVVCCQPRVEFYWQFPVNILHSLCVHQKMVGGWFGTIFWFWSIQSLYVVVFYIFCGLSNIWGGAEPTPQEKIFSGKWLFLLYLAIFSSLFLMCTCQPVHKSSHCTGTSWLLKHPAKWKFHAKDFFFR